MNLSSMAQDLGLTITKKSDGSIQVYRDGIYQVGYEGPNRSKLLQAYLYGWEQCLHRND